jgi:hypothetical protein
MIQLCDSVMTVYDKHVTVTELKGDLCPVILGWMRQDWFPELTKQSGFNVLGQH